MIRAIAPRRFCLVTSGRAGSSWLMDTLAAMPGIALPRHVCDCPDDELLHHRHGARIARLLGLVAPDAPATIGSRERVEAFYARATGATHAGFKTLPQWHTDDPGFFFRPDLRFIVLLRNDIVATVASFLVAAERGAWHDEAIADWTFTPAHHLQARRMVAFTLGCHALLRRIPGAIALGYESLTRPGFRSSELDEYFGQPIRLPAPRAPRDPARYVTNYDALRGFIETECARFADRHRSAR